VLPFVFGKGKKIKTNKGITHMEGHINVMEIDMYTTIMKITIDITPIILARMVIINITRVIIMMDFKVIMRNMEGLTI
jgi:hypothetical protein